MKTMRFFKWVLVMLWCALIFYHSGKPAPESQKQSLAIVTALNRLASSIAGKEVVIVTDAMVRKAAHFIEYAVLGFLLLHALYAPKGHPRAFWFALLMGVLYAVTDEVHQYFVPGRSMRLIDLAIDMAGVICGAGVAFIAARKNRLMTVIQAEG